MTDLPARPDLDQLRRQAKDLLRAAQAGDPAAISTITAVSERSTLAAAQLAVARGYGFASWPKLKAEVEARTHDLSQKVDEFLRASIRDWTGRAARLLAATPEIADYDERTAIVLGDADTVRQLLDRDPSLATRTDPATGFTALHAACASRWHRLDPPRADGLVATARLLLDAGADPAGRSEGPGSWTPLRCAVAGAANPGIVRLLLARGVTPENDDLYLACFGDDNRESLSLLLEHAPDIGDTTALAAPISTDDTETVRLLLAAGASASRPFPADLLGGSFPADQSVSPVAAALHFDCPVDLIALLLDAGGDPVAPWLDGRSPFRLAVRQGRRDVAELLARHGAGEDATDADRFLSACRQADRATVERFVNSAPGLAAELGTDGEAALVDAAIHGHLEAVELMLDAGFPVEARGHDGATPLIAAAGGGAAQVVRLLLDRGADLEARDTTWDSTALDWSVVGSGLRSVDNPAPDWIATVRILIDAGAVTAEISLSPDDPKPPSAEVAELLRSLGIGA